MTGITKRVDRLQWLKIPNVVYRMRRIIAVLVLTTVAWPGAVAGEGTWERVYDFSGTATVNIQVDFQSTSDGTTWWTKNLQASMVYQITGTEGDGSHLRPSGSITGSLSSKESIVGGKCGGKGDTTEFEFKTVCDGTIQEEFGRSPKKTGPQIKINRKLGLYKLSLPSAVPEGKCTTTDSCLSKTYHSQGPLDKIVVYIPAPYGIGRQECKGASFDPESGLISGGYSTTIETPPHPQREQFSARWTFRLGKSEPPKIKVKAVYFNYGSNNLKATLTLLRHEKDNDPIKAPEWKDDGTRESAAFALGYPFKVKVVFEAEDEVDKARIRVDEQAIKKDGFGGLKPTRKNDEVTFKNNIAEVEYIIKTAPQEVGIFEVLWQWKAKIKLRNQNEFEEKEKHFDTTDHKVYVVADIPIPTACTYEYVVRKSCEWADGASGAYSHDDVFDMIWVKFWQIPAPDNPGHLLKYSHDKLSPMAGTKHLLREGEGTCGAWADFFYDTVGSHGIQISHVTITPNPPFNWLVATKVAAQGNDKPARVFTNHAITAYKGRYYDPSYHFDTEQDCLTYENQAFAAYCQAETLDFLPPMFDNWITTCRPLYNQGKYNQFTDCLATQEPPGCQVNKEEKPCEVTMK